MTRYHYVDFTRGFAGGMAQLRRRLADPSGEQGSRKDQAKDTYTPPKSVIQDILVDPAPPPPEPDLNLELLYMQARAAFARSDWDTAEDLLRQVVELELQL